MLATPSHSLLKSLLVLEISRYKKEIGSKPPSWKEQLIAYEKQGGLFVHFSNYPRMGLYLVNEYKTPIGFYSYPLKRGSISNFATERPYAVIIKPKPEARILDLETYSKADYLRDFDLLVAAGFDRERMESARVSAYESDNKYASIIWNITRMLAKATTKYSSVSMYPGPKGGGPTGLWTYLLWKVLGYDGVVDDGLGLIYSAEPFQAVWFNTTKVEVVDILKKDEESGVDKLFKEKKSGLMVNKRMTSNEMEYLASLGLHSDQRKFVNVDFSNQSLNTLGMFYGAKILKCNFEKTTIKDGSGLNSNFTKAKIIKTNMKQANYFKVKFWSTAFDDVDVSWAIFDRCTFDEADLSGMKGWEKANFSGSIYDEFTKFPLGFDPKEKGMVLRKTTDPF